MHRNLPSPAQRIAVWVVAVLIFAAPALAQWTADTATGTPPAPTRTHAPASVVAGWDCAVHGTVCGNGTGVDRRERKP